jgi:hypothetical protein
MLDNDADTQRLESHLHNMRIIMGALMVGIVLPGPARWHRWLYCGIRQLVLVVSRSRTPTVSSSTSAWKVVLTSPFRKNCIFSEKSKSKCPFAPSVLV